MATHTHFLSLLLALSMFNISTYAVSPLGQDAYTAAVVEFTPEMKLNVSTPEQAMGIMMNNLRSFEAFVEEGHNNGANIIVFPEDGIYGFVFQSREELLLFLEEIPDPQKGKFTPCDDETFADRPVLTTLSCLAKDYTIVLVANMGDKQKCNQNSDTAPPAGGRADSSECPPDGWYMYNTNVAFDSDGSLLAKYHKTHLYSAEAAIFNVPDPTPHVSFQTSFGVTFGTFTCFDILYCDPPLELVKMGVRNFVFPTAWGNSYPFYTSIAFQQAWSWRTETNFLAANLHFPNADSFPEDISPVIKGFYLTGSGIFSAGKALATFISGDIFAATKGHLVLATLPKDPLEEATCTEDTCESTPTDPVYINTDIQMKSSRYLLYTLLENEQNGTVTATYTNKNDDLTLECSLNYNKMATTETETYALGAFIGGKPNDPEFVYGVCSLVKCPSAGLENCGSPVTGYVAETVFEEVELSGSFPDGSTVFPVIQLSNLELVNTANVMLEERGMVIRGLTTPLLSASLWGRVQPVTPTNGNE